MSITAEAQSSSKVPEILPQKPEQEDQIFTLDELIKRRASDLEDLPLFGYPNQTVTDFEEHSARSVDKYVDAAVENLQKLGMAPVVSIEVDHFLGTLSIGDQS